MELIVNFENLSVMLPVFAYSMYQGHATCPCTLASMQGTLLETVPTYQTVNGHLHFTTAPIVPRNLSRSLRSQ